MISLADFLRHPFNTFKRQTVREDEAEKSRFKKAEQEANGRANKRIQYKNDERDLQHRVYEGTNLPVLIDRGPVSAWHAQHDDVYWNSVLIQGERRKERHRPSSPDYDVLTHGKSLAEQVAGDSRKSNNNREKFHLRIKSVKGKEKAREPQVEQNHHFAITRSPPPARKVPGGRWTSPEVLYTESPTPIDSEQHLSHDMDFNRRFSQLSLLPEPLRIHCKYNGLHTSANNAVTHYCEEEIDSEHGLYHQFIRSNPTVNNVSLPFNEETCLPTDDPVLIYGSPGQRRRVLLQGGDHREHKSPLCPSASSSIPPLSLSLVTHPQQQQQDSSITNYQQTSYRPDHVGQHRTGSTTSSSYSVSSFSSTFRRTEQGTFSWNKAHNTIVNNEASGLVIADATGDRMRNSGQTNGNGCLSEYKNGGTNHVNAIDAGFVPDFSHPLAGADLSGKWATENEAEIKSRDDHTNYDRNSQKERPKELVDHSNGVHGAKTPASFRTSSGRTNKSSINRHLPNASPTPSLIGESRNQSYKSSYPHIPQRYQEPEISSHSLSWKLNKTNKKMSHCQQRKDFDIAQVEKWGTCEEHVLKLEEDLRILQHKLNGLAGENVALWDALEYSKTVLRLSFERENSILDMLWDFKERQDLREERFRIPLLGRCGSWRIKGSPSRSVSYRTCKKEKSCRQSSRTSYRSSVATIMSRFSREPSFASVKKRFSFYKKNKAQQTLPHGSRNVGTYDSIHSPSASSSEISLRSALQSTYYSSSGRAVRVPSPTSCSQSPPTSMTKDAKNDMEGGQTFSNVERKEVFPTVMQEIDAVIGFADLHIRKLVEDVHDFGDREGVCWELKMRTQGVEKRCDEESVSGLREALEVGRCSSEDEGGGRIVVFASV